MPLESSQPPGLLRNHGDQEDSGAGLNVLELASVLPIRPMQRNTDWCSPSSHLCFSKSRYLVEAGMFIYISKHGGAYLIAFWKLPATLCGQLSFLTIPLAIFCGETFYDTG